MKGLKKKNKLCLLSPEFIFITYFWSFLFLRLLPNYTENSFFYLLSCTLLLLSVFIGQILFFNRKLDIRIFTFPIIVLFFFIFNLSFRYNNHQVDLLYVFIYNGLIPVIFLSRVENVKKMMLLNAYYSFFLVLFFSLDQLKTPPRLGDYMAYGYNFALPVCIGLYWGFRLLNKKWLILPFIYQSVCSIIFANRGVLLGIMTSVIIIELWFQPHKTKTFLKLFVSFFFLFVLINYFSENVLLLIDSTLQDNGIQSYAISKYLSLTNNSIENVSESFYSGRLDIWETAIKEILEAPLLGLGIGAIYAKYGSYSHNILLDLLIDGGIVWMLFNITIFFLVLKKLLNNRNYNKGIGLLIIFFFLISFPKLFLSQQYIVDSGYICLLSILQLKNKKLYENIN